MSGIGSNACTVKLSATGLLTESGYNQYQHTVNLTFKDITLTAVPQPVFIIFRPDSVAVAVAGTFTSSNPSGDILSAMDTNTTLVRDIMAPVGGVPVNNGAIRSFTMRLYNGDTTEKIGEGLFRLRGRGGDANFGTLPTPPVLPGVNAKMGNMAVLNNQWYGYNMDDQLWYPLGFSGSSGAIQLDFGVTGIPGSAWD